MPRTTRKRSFPSSNRADTAGMAGTAGGGSSHGSATTRTESECSRRRAGRRSAASANSLKWQEFLTGYWWAAGKVQRATVLDRLPGAATATDPRVRIRLFYLLVALQPLAFGDSDFAWLMLALGVQHDNVATVDLAAETIRVFLDDLPIPRRQKGNRWNP